MINNIQLQTLIKFQDQIRIYHWQTTSYAQHKALGDLYDGISGLTDDFVESISGRCAQHVQFKSSLVVTCDPYKDLPTTVSKLNEFAAFLRAGLATAVDAASDTDLLNIRDEMLGLVNRTLYLLSLA